MAAIRVPGTAWLVRLAGGEVATGRPGRQAERKTVQVEVRAEEVQAEQAGPALGASGLWALGRAWPAAPVGARQLRIPQDDGSISGIAHETRGEPQ